jgi:hypothetical protein
MGVTMIGDPSAAQGSQAGATASKLQIVLLLRMTATGILQAQSESRVGRA